MKLNTLETTVSGNKFDIAVIQIRTYDTVINVTFITVKGIFLKKKNNGYGSDGKGHSS